MLLAPPGAPEPGGPFGPEDPQDAELAQLLGPDAPPGMFPQPEVSLPPAFMPGAVEDRLDLRVKMDGEAQETLGKQLAREFYYFESVFASRLMNASDWRDDASMMPDPGIFDGRDTEAAESSWRAQGRSMLSSVAARSAWQKLMQQIVAPQPPFVAEAEVQMYPVNGVEVDLVQRAADVEKAWAALLNRAGWRESCSDLFMQSTVACPCARKTVYKRETIHVPKRTFRQDDEKLEGLLMVGLNPQEAILESIEQDAQGRPKVGIEWEEKVVREGPEFSVIPMEELIFLPVTARYQSDAFAIGERVRLRGSFLMDKKQDRRSGYFEEAIDFLLTQGSDETSEWEQMHQQRAAMNADTPTESDLPEHREYACVELAYKGRLGGEKFDKWYWITFHPGTGTLLRCCYMLDRHGLCPYTVYNYFGSELMGMSVMMLNATYQTQYTTLWNYFLDLVTILANSGGSVFYDPTSGYDPFKYVLSPGAQIPIRRPKDSVVPFPIAQNIPGALQHILAALDKTKDDSQLLTSTSNISLGKEADGDKTLGEIQLVFGQDQAISEMNAYGTALACALDVEKFRQITAQYAREGKLQYVSQDDQGNPIHQFIEPELLAAPYRLIPAGLTASSSAQARYQKAAMTFQTVMTSPLGQVPEVVFDALEQLLQSLGCPSASKWVSLAKRSYAQAAAQDAAMMAGQEAQAAEQAATQQGNVEADRALQEQQMAQQAGAQEQQAALAGGEQFLKLLDLGVKAEQQKAAANGGGKRKAA